MPAHASSSPALGLKQFRHEGCYSYLVFDRDAREAVLIDPRADLLGDYRDFVAEARLTLKLVIDTRVHWHHLSGSHRVAEAYSVPIAMSRHTRSARVARKLAHGDRIEIGALRFDALETPGASPDAICLSGEGLLFSGDTVWIGEGAPLDPTSTAATASALWRSQRETLAGLSGATIVLPGYSSRDLIFSTLKVERERGPDFRPPTPEAFAETKREEPARVGGEIRRRIELNLEAAPADTTESHFGSAAGTGSPAVGPGARGVAAISVEKLSLKLKERAAGTCFVDVREADEFSAGHLPGAISLPLSELALGLARLQGCERVYVSCQTGRRSQLAARTLDYLGLPDVVNVSGGFQAWEKAGFATETG